MKTTRRQFLKRSAAAAAAVSAPYVWSSRHARSEDLNSRPTIAAIGVGGSRGCYSRGGKIAMSAAKHGQMIACCDVDDRHTAEFNAKFDNKLNLYRDYRELFDQEKPDVVMIGTPDHWHVAIAIAALRAGCDVYCEKPLTLTIDEGKQICRVVQETGRVMQVGTQQRSEYGLRFLKAIAMVQSGRLGEAVKAYVAIGEAPTGGPFQPTEAPSDLDWNLWLGPAREAPYMVERRKKFRWWLEYSGGKMTDWGAHHIDIAQWALGCDHTGPIEVSGTGKFPPIVPEDFDAQAFFEGRVTLPHAYNTPTEFCIDLKFANGAVINVNHAYKSEDGQTEFPNGILFVGERGRIFVNRRRLSGKPVEELTEADHQDLHERVLGLYKGKEPGDHMANFFQCLRDRSEPISDVRTHHRTMTSCHLCNLTLLLGRPLRWDPAKEMFPGDEPANALMTRPRRAPYVLEA